jgi:hypothetical protein
MGQAKIADLVTRRQYAELEERADEYLKTGDWSGLLRHIQSSGSKGKTRDAVVSLLQLEALGGTDSDVFKEFSNLEGDSLRRIRADSVELVMEILREQIANKHTYFIDIEVMAMTPYVILVKEVIDARKRELEQLAENPSRIDVLGTYYGFQILITDGSRNSETPTGYGYRRYYRRTWLDEAISQSAVDAIKSITGELADEVDMDKTYRTLGSSRIFKDRCTKLTADILANAVRLALYKVPGNRSSAARSLGRTEDLRTLAFLHHRLPLEQNRRVRMSIAEALGRVGHTSSVDILRERIDTRTRYLTKEAETTVRALGGISASECRETLIELLEKGGNTTKATAIQALARQAPEGLVGLVAPYLTHKSRPVARASVLTLSELGKEGAAAIASKATIVMKRIGYDRPSRNALSKMLIIPQVAGMKEVHQYFAKWIAKLERDFKNSQRYGSTTYSWYWRRRETRTRERFEFYLRIAAVYLKPPLDDALVRTAQMITRTYERCTIRDLAEKLVSRKAERRRTSEISFEQSHLSSYI